MFFFQNIISIFSKLSNYYQNTFYGDDVKNPTKFLEYAKFESGMAARYEVKNDDQFQQLRILYYVCKNYI